MHELGICRNLIDVALSAMAERGAAGPAKSLQVEVGRFTAVVPDSLRFYFDVLSRGTLLEGAELEIESIPLRTRCRSCAQETEPELPSLLCLKCDGVVEIVSGRELRLVSVDVPEEAA
jgi:hydrogenase nickel incorporation protein HypA/HybF